MSGGWQGLDASRIRAKGSDLQVPITIGIGLFFFLLVVGNAVDLDPKIQNSSRGQILVREPTIEVSQLAANHGDRYGVYVALATYAPGSSILVDPEVTGLNDVFLVGIGRVTSISKGQVRGRSSDFDGESLATGEFRSLRWDIRLEDQGPQALQAQRVDDFIQISPLDREEDEAGSTPEHEPASVPPASRSILRDGFTDGLVASLLGLLGSAALGGIGLPLQSRIPLGFLLGTAVLAGIGLFRPVGLLGLVCACLILTWLAWVANRGRPRPNVIESLAFALLIFVAATSLSTFSRALGLVSTSPDSFRYLAGGAAMSAGQLGLESLDPKHMVGQQALHGPLMYLEVDGFQSLGPLVLMAGLLLLLEFCRNVTDGLGPLARTVLPVAVLVGLGTSPSIWIMAAYINSHVLFAGLLLGFLYLWYLSVDSSTPASQNAAAGMLVGLTVLRPEGILIVGVLFVACMPYMSGRSTASWGVKPWIIAGCAGALWNVLLIAGTGLQLAAVAFLTLSIMLILVALTSHLFSVNTWVWARRASAAFLWLSTIAFLLLGRERLTFFSAIESNIFEGEGGWGLTGIFLTLALMLGHVWLIFGLFSKEHGPMFWVVVLFLPVVLFLKLGDGFHAATPSLSTLMSIFAEGGGRVGWGDSVNRMWMHVVLLAPVVLLSGLSEMRRRSAESSLSTWEIGRRLLASATAVMAVLALWNPTYLDSGWVRTSPLLAAAVLLSAVGFSLVQSPPQAQASESSAVQLAGSERASDEDPVT